MSKNIAKQLLDLEAVFLSPKKPFTWASGIKSPIYCDNRLILSDVGKRNLVENALSEIIKNNYPTCTNVVGTATAGISHSSIVAHILQLPNAYVRTSNKEHGRQNKIEGKISENDNVVVIEDLISTGGSVLKVCEEIKKTGANVLAVVSIFTYDMPKAKATFTEANIKYESLTNIHELTEVALRDDIITLNEQEQILTFIKNPSDESWMM